MNVVYSMSLYQILNEVVMMFETIQSDMERGVVEHNLPQHIDSAIGSIISSLLFGSRFGEVMEDY